MAWLVIDAESHDVVSGPHDLEPKPAAGRYTTLVMAGFPDTRAWSAPMRGFVAVDDEAALIRKVKADASSRKMKVLTTGTAKSKIYAAKQAEVTAFYAAGGATQSVSAALAMINNMSALERDRRYRYALVSAKLRGETTIQKAIERFNAGALFSDKEVARIEAIEELGCERIRAATTAAAKRAAFAAINWNWAG
jgi:hypothetical protein